MRFVLRKHEGVGRLGASVTFAVAGAVVVAGVTTVLTEDVPSSSGELPQGPPAQPTASAPPNTPPGPLPLASPAPVTDPDIAERARDAAQEIVPGAEVGIEVFDRQAGVVVTRTTDDLRMPCMSVVKLFIALDVIDGSPGGVPDPATAGRLERMLRYSDDDIASAFWGTHGGPQIVTRTAERLGLANTEAPADEPGQWGDVLSTPQDLTTTYRYITDRLHPPARDLVLGALSDIPETADAGDNQHFGIPEGFDGFPWAVKQGWGTSGSQAIMNSTGTVGPESRYIVVVMVTASASSYGALPRAVTEATRALEPSLAG